MVDFDIINDEVSDSVQKTSVFSKLKSYCLELLSLLQNPRKDSSSISSLLLFLRTSPPDALQPFFDYTLFPLLLLLDTAVDTRSSNNDKQPKDTVSVVLHKVSDKVAEAVLQCLEELLNKCHLQSAEQMVVLIKKLTHAAMLSPLEASEEFREGVIKCFRALLLSLLPCSDDACSCRQSLGWPPLFETADIQALQFQPLYCDSGRGECLLAFLQSQSAAAAVGHWLSLLLKAADTEAERGHRGNSKLRVEAFITLRMLVSKIGTANALAFFLPGVVSQFAKVLHVSKSMMSGAAGSVEATNQAIRGLAEYLMIVLEDDANLSRLGLPLNDTGGLNLNKNTSVRSLLEDLRHLHGNIPVQSEILAEEPKKEAANLGVPASGFEINSKRKFVKDIGSLHVDRSKDWIEKTAEHVDKLLGSTFPQICVHPAKKVRQGLLAAIRGLLSKCSYTLKQSRLMLLECLFLLVVDDSEEVSSHAQDLLEILFSSSGKHQIQHDIAEIFTRLIEKLPKVMLCNEESLALSHAQQLLVVVYYSGPQFVLDQLLSPASAARFLDVFAVCLSQNSVYAGALDKLTLARPSSVGYLPSIAELKAGSQVASTYLTILDIVPSDISKNSEIQTKRTHYPLEIVENCHELPRMPPWFMHVGSQKLYQALSGILRLVGLSLMADFRDEGHMSTVIDIPLDYLRKLITEVRLKEYSKESWQAWYNRTGSGQLLRNASTATCILNELIFGVSNQSVNSLTKMFQKSAIQKEWVQAFDARVASGQPCTDECSKSTQSMWKLSQEKASMSHLTDSIGRVLHEYLSSEVWDLPIDYKPSCADNEAEQIALHFFHDTAMLHQVIIDGIGTFSLCLGKSFASSGFLHSSLYLLLESLICSNSHVRSASDVVLHVLATTSGYSTVGQLVLANADYVIDSICRQLRHLDLNPHVPRVLASMLSYIGVAREILPLLEEPMRSVSQELEILSRHQHPELTIPFLKAVGEIVNASKREASSLPTSAESYLKTVKSNMEREVRLDSHEVTPPDFDNHSDTPPLELEQWERIIFKLNDSRRYRRTVGSIAGSCLTAAIPLLASMKQETCLIALDVIEDGIRALDKVEEAYRHEKETREKIEEMTHSLSLYQLQDMLGVAEDGADENRLLPAMNKIWPFLVICVRNKNPVAVRRCLNVISKVVLICGGDFFSRRFQTDGPHFWKLLSTSPFQKKRFSKEEKVPLQLPYRNISSEESVAETSNLKVQVSVLNMIADLSRNKRSASSLEVVLKKVSGLVVGIACSGVTGLQDASVNALQGLASMDPDLIWVLLADVYYTLKKKDLPSPPSPSFPVLSQILPPLLSSKGYLHVQYGGQSYGFEIDFSSVVTVFKKLHAKVFSGQMYI
ncbi:ARM repeat superfamily protein [Euphorbia peplus]|nr:ARM repeat superfamily protein [Euphorbia peplus]